MIYDIELYKNILSVELEEMKFGDNKYEYKISNFIKLLENLGCTRHICDLRQEDGYALVTMTLSDKLIAQAEVDEVEFTRRIEDVVMMMFLEDGLARYLPPIFPSTTEAIKKLIAALEAAQTSLDGMTAEEQEEAVNKIIGDLGLGGDLAASVKVKKEPEQMELTESMNDLLVEIKDGTFSIFGFSGSLTKQLSEYYDMDFSKIAIEVSDNVFKPIDYSGSVIEFDNEAQLVEWASERFQVY